jgi:hypothetical protein
VLQVAQVPLQVVEQVLELLQLVVLLLAEHLLVPLRNLANKILIRAMDLFQLSMQKLNPSPRRMWLGEIEYRYSN